MKVAAGIPADNPLPVETLIMLDGKRRTPVSGFPEVLPSGEGQPSPCFWTYYNSAVVKQGSGRKTFQLKKFPL